MSPTPYTIYHATDSLCSLMLRYTFAIRGPSKDGIEITVNERRMDIHEEREQLSEWFLCDINPLGKVPAITSPALEKPMADSEDVTYYLATMFPNLIPDSHRIEITELLHKIHQLPYFTLSFGGHEAAASPLGALPAMRKMLDGNQISERHRKALQAKYDMAAKVDMSSMLTPGAVSQAEATLKAFFERISKYLPEPRAGPWMFGLEHASALDAHLVPMMVRFQDVGRGALWSSELERYLQRAKKTIEWQNVMGEQKTTVY